MTGAGPVTSAEPDGEKGLEATLGAGSLGPSRAGGGSTTFTERLRLSGHGRAWSGIHPQGRKSQSSGEASSAGIREKESRDMRRPSRWGWGRRAAVGAIAALAVGALASIGAAVSPSRGPAAAAQYPKKVTICHHTHSKKNPFVTITVSRNALPAHLRHSDTLGPCPAGSKAKKATASHGKSRKHAKKSQKVKASAPARGGVARGQAASSPGHSGSAPGHSGKTSGHATSPPGRSRTSPAPDQSQTPSSPDQAPSSPGNSGNAPGHSGSAPGNSGNAPGHSGSAPGHGASPPGHSGSAPGHGGTPPGQGKK